MARLAEDGTHDDNATETLLALTAYPATQCRNDLAQAVQLQPDLLFAKGEYIPNLEPNRLGLP